MVTKNIKKILLNKDRNKFIVDIEDIESRITQNSSNLEIAKQELSNKCNEALSEAKAYTDTEKAKYLPLTGGTVTGLLNCTASNATADVNNKALTSYVADITGANAQLSIIKGDGTTSTATINNVANATNATNADNLGGYPASDYVKSVNSIAPDEQGNVQLEGLVKSVNGINADANGNVQLGSLDNSGAITGEIKWFAFNTAPDGYLVCNGANVSRTTYADLFAVIGTTFGEGDSSTTFNLPDLRDRYIIGAGINALGAKIAEQLPNITGTCDLNISDNNINLNSSGALRGTSGPYTRGMGLNSSLPYRPTNLQIQFNATNSTTTYVNNGHVYPLSLALLPCIKY